MVNELLRSEAIDDKECREIEEKRKRESSAKLKIQVLRCGSAVDRKRQGATWLSPAATFCRQPHPSIGDGMV
jgi:hypothetical protein